MLFLMILLVASFFARFVRAFHDAAVVHSRHLQLHVSQSVSENDIISYIRFPFLVQDDSMLVSLFLLRHDDEMIESEKKTITKGNPKDS